ncbi:MAG TPA: glycosyltransferase [Anaerolineales bacterium]|nr:glycosyltransferase [Anaerolineales bacterium]
MMAPKGINVPLLFRMRNQIKNFAPDILHVHGLQSEGLYGLVAGRLARCKRILVTVHGLASDTVEMNSIKRILYKYIVEPYTLRNVDFVYCVCDYASNRPIIKKNARKLLGTIYTGIKPVTPTREREQTRDELGLAQGKIVGIIVSRNVKDKGYDELSRVISWLHRRGEDRLRFCIVGEGGYVEELNQRLNQEISAGYTRLCGRRDDVVDLLFASDFFILPSWHENFPVSLLEAGQAGLPAIATRVGGIPEIIEHGQTGLLVSENDPGALIQAIDRLLDNPDQISQMGKNARLRMRTSFSLEAMTEKIHKAYFEILQ